MSALAIEVEILFAFRKKIETESATESSRERPYFDYAQYDKIKKSGMTD